MFYSFDSSSSRVVFWINFLFSFILLMLLYSSTSPSVLAITIETWSNGAGNLQWGTADNWNPSGVPDATKTALFTDLGLSSGNTVDFGGDHSVNDLSYNTNTSFTIGGSSGVLTIASGSLTRSAASSGTQTIARPVALGANAVWTLDGSGSLNVTNEISGHYSLEKWGTATLNLSGANTYNGATRVKKGTLIISGGSTASTSFEVSSATTLSFTGGSHSIGGASFANTGMINFDGATISLGASSTTIPGNVNFSQGTLSGTGTSTFTGPFNWTGGTMSGNGTTVTQGSANYFMDDLILDGHTLTNTGMTTFSPSYSGLPATSTYLYGRNGAIFNNQTGKTVTLQGPTYFINDGGAAPTINNSGTFRALPQSGGIPIDIEYAMNNTGSVEVNSSGTVMNLAGGGTSTGAFRVNSSGAALAFTGGTHNLIGTTFYNSGTINFDGATVSFTTPTAPMTIPGTVNFSQGTLSGTGTVTLTGPFSWTGGTMSGNGTTVTQGSTNNFVGDLILDGRTLTNAGTTVFSSSYYSPSVSTTYLYGRNGTIFNNQPGKTVTLQGSTSFINDGGAAPTINNSGMFRVSSTQWPSCQIDVEFAMNNSGTIQLEASGTVMNLADGGTSTGIFNVNSSGSTLTFTGGTHNLIGATFNNSSGKIIFDGATVSFSSPTTIPGTVNFIQGTLSSTGTVTLTGPFSWTGGTMSGNGTTVTQGSTNYFMGDLILDGRTLTNTGTDVFSPYYPPGPTLSTHLYGRNGAIFNNQTGRTVTLQGPTYFINDGGATPTINNSGTFRALPQTGTIDIGFIMNNTGIVDVQKSSMNLQGGVTQLVGNTLTGGTWKVRANSMLDITTGGNITTNQGNVTLDGLGSTFNKINSLIDNQGDFSVLNGRNFTTVADLANSGTLTVGEGSSFTVSGNLTGAGNTIVDGMITANSIIQNSITLGPGATLTIPLVPGGPLGNETMIPVPEPGTLIMLLIAAATAGGLIAPYGWKS